MDNFIQFFRVAIKFCTGHGIAAKNCCPTTAFTGRSSRRAALFGVGCRRWTHLVVGNGNGEHSRDGKWTESAAVGSALFVTATKDKLGVKGIGLK